MISENVFTRKDFIPNESKIKHFLKLKYPHLTNLRQFIRETFGETPEEWKYYGEKNGWLLKKYYKKRNLFFISICDGYFKITFVFREKAVNAIIESNISPELINVLTNAKKYAEGRGLTIIVDGPKYLKDIKQLLHIKIHYCPTNFYFR